MWTRLIGAVLLLVATVCTVIYAIVLVWDSFDDKSVNLVIPIAYVTYSSVMAQVAFALLSESSRVLCRFLLREWIACPSSTPLKLRAVPCPT